VTKGRKKAKQPQTEFFVDGRPARLRDVRSRTQDATLKEALGDYISAVELHNKVGIRDATLRRWRNSGKIRAERIRGRWYYSLQDILRDIKEEPNHP
jgi:hypothetical protein